MPRTAAVPSSPPPAGEQARPQRRQRVKVPLRLVTNPHYADVAVIAYVKIAALASRPEGCTAATATIAEYVGLSKASIERGMTQLMRPGPDGVVELSSTRRSLPGGCGTSAVRRTRPLSATERFVWIPVAAAEDLTPRQLRAYALIAYAQAQRIPLTESEIAGALHHHSGRRAGQPLTTAAAGQIVDGLEAKRWITVERRASVRGRHHFVAHDIPPAAQDLACGQPSSTAVAPPTTSGPGEGSGSSADAGSLATKEEPRTDRPDDERASSSPAAGEVQVGEGVENHGPQPPHSDGEGDLALRADDHQTPLTTPL
ncbi:SMC-Scp complex subunit ScpB, partial [Streptomyces lavenduligriseus]|nr:SMC-Scp complex subunit ScpB [Streptomyces lavenduligriseus]